MMGNRGIVLDDRGRGTEMIGRARRAALDIASPRLKSSEATLRHVRDLQEKGLASL